LLLTVVEAKNAKDYPHSPPPTFHGDVPCRLITFHLQQNSIETYIISPANGMLLWWWSDAPCGS